MRFSFEKILFLLSFCGGSHHLVHYHVHGADINNHPTRNLEQQQHHGGAINDGVEDTQYLRGAGVLPALAGAHEDEEQEGTPTYDEKKKNLTYSNVSIVNSTDRNISGRVEYASLFCSDDDYRVAPNRNWQASSRGACLVTKITAKADGVYNAISYTSSGTSYSQFAIIDLNDPSDSKYQVTRRVS